MTAKTDRAAVVGLVLEVMRRTNTSQKVLALNAETPQSVICDALNPRGQRNFALEWLCDQDDGFLLTFIELVMRARGLTPQSRGAVIADHLAELVRAIAREIAA